MRPAITHKLESTANLFLYKNRFRCTGIFKPFHAGDSVVTATNSIYINEIHKVDGRTWEGIYTNV